MPILAVFSWNKFTLPSGFPAGDLLGDTHANDPAHPDYAPTATTWIGETFTFDGGTPSQIVINDDDAYFEDGYVETGTPQTLNQAVTIDGVDYPAGSVVENEFSMLDAAGNEVFIVRINGVNVGFAYPIGQEPTPGSTFTGTTGRDGAAIDSGDGMSPSQEPYANMVCFAEGTLITTPGGECPVEQLTPGDMVMTLDRGAQPIRWVRKSIHTLKIASPDDKPVLFRAGSLGRDCPTQDLVVSPQHRIFLGGGNQLEHVFNDEVLAPAKSLVELPGVRRMSGKKEITYVHFACDRHEIVYANGCLSESLLLGRMVLNGLSVASRRKLAMLYVKRKNRSALNGPPARECLTFGEVGRHLSRATLRQNNLIKASAIQRSPKALRATGF